MKKTFVIGVAVFFGLVVDQIYNWLGISPQVLIGQHVESIPPGLALGASIFLIFLSIGPLLRWIRKIFDKHFAADGNVPETKSTKTSANPKTLPGDPCGQN